jgi:hypothetical protein
VCLIPQTRNAKKACPYGVPLPEWISTSKQIGNLLLLVYCIVDVLFSLLSTASVPIPFQCYLEFLDQNTEIVLLEYKECVRFSPNESERS